jgi:hypothetical protein
LGGFNRDGFRHGDIMIGRLFSEYKLVISV